MTARILILVPAALESQEDLGAQFNFVPAPGSEVKVVSLGAATITVPETEEWPSHDRPETEDETAARVRGELAGYHCDIIIVGSGVDPGENVKLINTALVHDRG